MRAQRHAGRRKLRRVEGTLACSPARATSSRACIASARHINREQACAPLRMRACPGTCGANEPIGFERRLMRSAPSAETHFAAVLVENQVVADVAPVLWIEDRVDDRRAAEIEHAVDRVRDGVERAVADALTAEPEIPDEADDGASDR